jgi:4-carboxymuconolactone decarboxylase
VSEALLEREGLLVDVSAALASAKVGGVETALRAALAGAADPAEVEEALLQSYLFLGYPRALAALGVWRRISERKASEAAASDWAAWEVRGGEVCRRVYGGQYEPLRENVRALHPDLETWMVVEGYGKVLGRAGLELRVRELCIAALLAVLDAPAQLRSHLRGALNVGASPEQVEAALARALAWASPAARESALETWGTVRARWISSASEA